MYCCHVWLNSHWWQYCKWVTNSQRAETLMEMSCKILLKVLHVYRIVIDNNYHCLFVVFSLTDYETRTRTMDEIVQSFGWIQSFYVGLVKKIRQYFFPQIKKSCSLVYFSSALDTVSIISTNLCICIQVSDFFVSNDSHPWII